VSSQPLRFILSQRRTQFSFALLGVVAMFIALLALAATPTSTTAQTVPTFSIVAVSRDQAVQIRTANFPASTDFTVRMGPMGTRGINGTAVATVNSGSGGTIDWSFAIPANLAGSAQIAVRLESANGFFAYNWFFNNNTAVAPQPPIIGSGGTGGIATPVPTIPAPPPSTGIPTFSIVAVDRNNSVQIRTANFPANTTFTVRMGYYGTQAINGVQIAFVNSGAGGTIDWRFVIPAYLANQDRIAIRLDSQTGPHNAFNWFFNNSTNPGPQGEILGDGGAAPPTGGDPQPPTVTTPAPPVTQFPTMAVSNVVRNQSATARLYNLSANTSCTTQMGPYGSQGFGFAVGSFNTDAGGTQDMTFTIPSQLVNSYRIAIRFDCANGTFAFNWFYNNTATVPVP
jgi:hypothetical protein